MRPIAASVSPIANAACDVRVLIAAALQIAKADALDELHHQKGRKILPTVRLGMNHLRNANRRADHSQQVNFFLTKRWIVLVHAQHNAFRRAIEN